MGWWMLIPTLFGIALLGVLIWAVARLTSPRRAPGGQPIAGLTPEDILRRRYASGEIDEKTLQTMREQLGGAPTLTASKP
jgi:putative membrane protein